MFKGKKVRVGLLGFGVVGGGFLDIVEKNIGKNNIEIVVILVKNREKYRSNRYFSKITEDINTVFERDLDIIVEVIGGIYPAFDYIKMALERKIHVVTSNKNLIAEKGGELAKLSIEHNVNLKFEAAVAGGIPIIKTIGESLGGNRINSIKAILNGTTNFILSKMYNEDVSYEAALKESQNLDFAETDTDSDILGYDAARKLGILSTLAYNKQIYWKDAYLEGLTKISKKDIDYAKKINCKIKLVGYSKYENNEIVAFVRPLLVEENDILARVDNEFNIIVVNGDSVGDVTFVGKGVGRLATGSAVYSDIIDIIDSRVFDIGAFCKEKTEVKHIIAEKCGVLIRFKGYNKNGIIEIINENFLDYKIIDEKDELVIFANANSEYEINSILNSIKNKGYYENCNKVLKIVRF